MKKYLVLNLCLVLWSFTSAVVAQHAVSEQNRRYVVVPPENFLLTVAAQPDCPLRIENAKFLMGADQGWAVSCQLRNQGTKPIRFLTLVAWTTYGTGGTLSSAGRHGDKLIMPGQMLACNEDSKEEIMPLTDDLRDKLKLRGSMKAVIVLMVESIKFADGSSYGDEATSTALRAYFQDLPERPEP